MGRLNDLTGRVFGALTVLERAPDRKKNRYWKVRCECGCEKIVAGASLTRGATTTCSGHIHRVTHGHTIGGNKSPEYQTWLAIKQRCLNPNSQTSKYYSNRGITMSDHWRNSFEAFFADMGKKPSSKHSIDRIDNDGPYSKDNCRWAVRKEQMSNTRSNRLVTIDGDTKTLTEWCETLGVNKSMVRNRVSLGWDEVKALLTPKNPVGRKPSGANPRTL